MHSSVTEWQASLASSANGVHGLASLSRHQPLAQRPLRGRHPGFLQPTSYSTTERQPSPSAAHLLIPTRNYHQCHRGSSSSNSPCGSAGHSGQSIPHHPALPPAGRGHWWTSCFQGKSTLPFMATLLEFPRCSESPPSLQQQHHLGLGSGSHEEATW